MNYYLKYRPQTAAELDLLKVREAFELILASGTFSHAYLFAGPKGTGKTSSARILAKVLNCHKNTEQTPGSTGSRKKLNEPCGECGSCRAIVKGTAMAVIEMDAASNRGIDDIRTLRERVGLAPADGKYSVYVIDEVHMLTTEAFNALLKTLEEPPEHAVFVLCTTELNKVPETIVSRCTQIVFTRAAVEEIVGSLQKAVEGEKLKPDKGVLEAIANRVEGSFRDGMKILEQLTQSGVSISLQEVDELTGYGGVYDVSELIKTLKQKDAPAGLAVLKKVDQAGADWVMWATRLVETSRQNLINEVTSAEPNKETVAWWQRLAEMANRATLDTKQAIVPQLPLELLVVEWATGGRAEKDKDQKNESNEQKASSMEPGFEREQKNVALESKGQTEGGGGIDVTGDKNGKEFKTDWGAVEQKWPEVLRGVRPHNHSIEALLRAARPIQLANETLTVEVFYTFHKEQLEQERHLKVVESVTNKVFGQPYRIKYVLGERVQKAHSGSGKAVENVTGKIADEKLAEAAEEIFGN